MPHPLAVETSVVQFAVRIWQEYVAPPYHRMDPGIISLVQAVRLYATTTGSGEGHLGGDVPHPWVDIPDSGKNWSGLLRLEEAIRSFNSCADTYKWAFTHITEVHFQPKVARLMPLDARYQTVSSSQLAAYQRSAQALAGHLKSWKVQP
jgi:hypothetical protein